MDRIVFRLAMVLKRLAWIVAIVPVVVIAVGVAMVGALTMRGIPATSGALSVVGLEDAVRVTRDAAGIAWIEAESTHDLFLRQGYVHAQERMWQMEVWRHISAGRLSELFGASTLGDPDDADYVPVGIVGVFGVTNLPSYRLSIDMKDLDGARIVQTTGQSGNPFDRHYGDLIDDWLIGETVPLPFTREAVREATVETLQLVPRSGG